MPRKRVSNDGSSEEKSESEYINEYDPTNGLPFDNNEVNKDIDAEEEIHTVEEEHNTPIAEEPEIKPVITVEEEQVQEEPKRDIQTLTEAELENVIGSDDAIIDQEIDPKTSGSSNNNNNDDSLNLNEPITTYGGDQDPYTDNEERGEQEEQEGKKTSNSKKPSLIEQLEREKKKANRIKSIKFLEEYAKEPLRSVDEVTDKLGISLKAGKEFVNEYIKIVKRAVEDNNYPDDVLEFYNRGISKDKQLAYHHMNRLKDIVKKYSTYDVNANLNKTLNRNDNDTFISNNRVAQTFDNRTPMNNNPLSQFNGYARESSFDSDNDHDRHHSSSEIKEIRDGITSLQLIKLLLVNAFGQAAKMRVSSLIGDDPTPVLTDEKKMKDLLVMVGATQDKAQTFIELLKTHAHRVSNPIGFLSYANRNMYGGHGGIMGGGGGGVGVPGGPGMMGGGAFGPVGMGAYDQAMNDFYYQHGVYLPGLPPEHPINQENLQKYKKKKQQEDQLEAMTAQSEMLMRMQMVKAMSQMGGDSNGSGRSSSLFTPEMLLVTGLGRYERTGVDEQGKPIYAIVPNLAGGNNMGGVGVPGGMPGQPGVIGSNGLPLSPIDQTSSTLGLVKEIMQTMQIMQQQTQAQQGGEKSFFNEVMGGLAQRVLAPPPQDNKLKDFVETFQMLQQMPGGGGLLGGGQQGVGGASPPDPMVVLETQRLQNEKEFGLQALRLKEKDMDMKAQAAQKSDSESNNNMKWLVSQFSESLSPVLSTGLQFLFNRGGMPGGMGGMMGGGAVPPGMDGAAIPGMGAGGANNAALNTIIEMEYAKEERRKKEEAEKKKKEWEEEVERKNEERRREIEYYRAMGQAQQQQGGGGPQQQQQQQQQPAPYNPMNGPTFRVGGPGSQSQQQQPAASQIIQPDSDETGFQVQQPVTKPMVVGSSLEDQNITIKNFLPHSIDTIQANLEKVRKHQQFLERYAATAEEAINEKIANGESVTGAPVNTFGVSIEDDINQGGGMQEGPTWMSPEAVQEKQEIEINEDIKELEEKNQQDINTYLQNFPSEAVDPDYTGPETSSSDLEEYEKEEETDIGDVGTINENSDKEEIDI